MKLKHLQASLTEDMQTILDHVDVSIDDPGLNHGKTGLMFMHKLLNKVSSDRAYDDSHPNYIDGKVRILDYDGRDYCWYYADGAHDDHVATLLRAVKRELK